MAQEKFSVSCLGRILGVLALVLCFCTLSSAQTTSQGTIAVIVFDPSNATVSGAELELHDLATNDIRKGTTQDKGVYRFVNLPVGTYKLTVSKAGFETAALDLIRVQASQVTDLTVSLKVGVSSVVVEVYEESGPLMETTSNAISSTIDIKQIEDLPLGGRDLTGLSYLVPGYTGAFSGLPSIAEGNNIDGIIGSPSRMKFTGNSQSIVSARLEDIQEMTVQTDQLDLSSGFGQSNMQINYITRRGTNNLHGRVYEDFRNAALNANTWVNNATNQAKPNLILNDFGGSAGGAILKDKLFFFGSFAMSKQPGGYQTTNLLLAPATQAGNFTYTYTDTSGVHTVTVNLLQLASNYNAANPGKNLRTVVNTAMIAPELQQINSSLSHGTVSGNADVNLQTLSWQQTSPLTYYYPTLRLDYNISQKYRVNFAWNETKNHQPGASAAYLPGPTFASEAASTETKNYTASLGFDWTIGPTLINQFRGGMLYNWTAYAYDATKTYASNPIVNWNYYGVQYPYGGNMSGQQFNLPISTYYPLFNASDTVSWQRSAHTMSFGFSFYREQDHYWNAPAGIVAYNLSLATGDPAIKAFTNGASGSLPNASQNSLNEAQQLYAILVGDISSVGGQYAYNSKTGQYLNGVGAYNLDELQKAWGLFYQDSYRIRPSFTLNYGLRWDFTGDDHDLTGAYHGATPQDLYGPSGVGNLFNPGSLKGTMDPLIAARAHQYAGWNVSPQPSIGIAWNPQGKEGVLGKLTGGRTVIRSGFSLRRFTEPYQYFWDNASDYGNFFYQNFSLNSSGTGQAGTFIPGTLALGDTLPPYLKNPTAYQAVAHQSAFTFVSGAVPVNGMDPHIQQPYTLSWNLGVQREIGRNGALEVRYIGSRSPHQWVSLNVNEINIFAALPGQPTFLQQFISAQKNLQICMANANCSKNPSFGNQGLPGQVALPIFEAAFTCPPSGCPANVTPGQDFTNPNFITNLNTGQAGALAGVLTTTTGTVNYFCNLVGASFAPCVNNANFPMGDAGAGYPINFFQANPFQSGPGSTFNEGLMEAAGWSDYHGLVVDFRQRQWHGLQFDANYTWSHTLGTATANSWQGVVNQFTIRDLRRSYGPTLFDLRHVIHANATYDLPLGKGKAYLNHGGVVDKVVGGWTAGTIFTYHTGYPFQLLGGFNTFNDYGDGGIVLHGVTLSQLQSSVGVYPVPCAAGNSGCTNGFVNFINPKYLVTSQGGGANSAYISPNTTPGVIGATPFLYGPHFSNFDIAITKAVPIGERFKFKLQSEFLNAFNHPNFGAYPPPPSMTIQNNGWGQTGMMQNPGQFSNFINPARVIELRANIEF